LQLEDEARALRNDRRIEQRIAKREEKGGEVGIFQSEQNAALLNILTLGIAAERAKEEEDFIRRKEEALAELEKEEQKRKKEWWKNILSSKQTTTQDDTTTAVTEINGVDESIKAPPINYYTDPDLLQNRPWAQRALVLSGGVIFNLILAFTLYFGEMTVGNGLPRPMFEPGAVVSAPPRVNAPSAGVLQPGDLILGINGEKMLLSKTYDTAVAQGALNTIITTIRSTPPGENIQLTIVRDGTTKDITLTPKPSLDKLGNPTGPQSIGASLAPNYIKSEYVQASSIGDAIAKSTEAVTTLTTQTATSLTGFFASLLSGKGAPAGQSMSGPIGVIRTGADIVSSNDFTAVIMFAAAISINLAVVNSLPLPALDGGQLVFVLAEAVAGRKIDQRVQEEINAAALLFLVIFSFSTAIGDVGSLIGL